MAKKTKATIKKAAKSPAKKGTKKRAPKTESEHGQIFFQWTFPEFEMHARQRGWYIIMFLLAGGFFIYSIWIANYLFIVIILIVFLIYALDHMRQPLDILFQINEDGIIVGKRFYRWKDLDDFWIAYDPPEVKRLYFSARRKVFSTISIPLEEFNPVAVRRVLLSYLKENLEKEEEPPSETVARAWKL